MKALNALRFNALLTELIQYFLPFKIFKSPLYIVYKISQNENDFVLNACNFNSF